MPPACVLERQQRLNHLQHLFTRVGQDQAFAMALKQRHPSCASRWRIWRVSGGCEINNRCAARLMLFSSATTAKARSRRISRECNLEVVILKRYHEKGITQVRHTSLPFLLTHHHREGKTMSSERYIIGQEMLQRVDGKGGKLSSTACGISPPISPAI